MIEPRRRLEILLRPLRDAAVDATNFVDGPDLDDFLDDRRAQPAVAMSLVIIGELANTVLRKLPDLAASYPEVELGQMRDMRNRIAHGHFDLDFSVVWKIVGDDLPPLIQHISAVIAELER